MRPEIIRPDVQEIAQYFSQQLGTLSGSDYEQGVQLERLFVNGYHGLMLMSQEILICDWAGMAMVGIAKCGGVVMKMGLMSRLFDLLYSLLCGYASPRLCFLDNELIQYFKSKYGSTGTTYKDVYDISVTLSESFSGMTELFTVWRQREDIFTARDFVAEMKRYQFVSLSDSYKFPLKTNSKFNAFAEATEEYIVSYLWKAARTAYYKLKLLGQIRWDFDAVFQLEEPPFPGYVFFDLLGRYEFYCGCIPVGQVGLFSEPNMSVEAILDGLHFLKSHVVSAGTARAPWEIFVDMANESKTKGEPPEVPWPAYAGEGKLSVSQDDGFDPAEEILRMGRLSNHPREAAQYVGEGLHKYRVLNQGFLRAMCDFQDYYNTENIDEPFNPEELGEEMMEAIKRPVYSFREFGELFGKQFHISPYCQDGAFVEPERPPFEDDAIKLQATREFMFFRELLDSDPGDVTGGLFVQSCIDYCNWFDPEVHREGENWVDWKIAKNMSYPDAYINDKRLFVSMKINAEDKKCTLKGRMYNVTASGIVVYGYTNTGKALFAMALYCEGLTHNLLSSKTYQNVRQAVNSNWKTGMVRLPFLQLKASRVVWRGYEVKSFDASYWHKQLGHLSLKGIKRYAETIKGMPPYFWPYKLECSECNSVQQSRS
ncbi:hypothetical protein CJU89_4123 [Yarrowia sp. B02]|nr:hypothetical protein CJU89_4123 [Yarrowia sp. B02]